MKSILIILSLLFISTVSTAQVKIYGGVDIGSFFFLPPGNNTENIKPEFSVSGVWGGILGLDFRGKWLLETGYFGTSLSQRYQYQFSSENPYRSIRIVQVSFASDAFPLRFKKKINFTFLKNDFSFLPSIGATLFVVSKNRYRYFEDTSNISYGLPDTLFINKSRQVLSSNRFHATLEGAVTLQTPFIIKPLSIFIRGSYNFGIIPLTKTEVNYSVQEDGKLIINDKFTFSSRMSYFNASIGFIIHIGRFGMVY